MTVAAMLADKRQTIQKLIILMILAFISSPATAANYCDDKMEPGESIDGKEIVTVTALMIHALAERYCGATPTPISRTLVVVEEGHGCGPRSEVEEKIEKEIADGYPAKTEEIIRHLVVPRGETLPASDVDIEAKEFLAQVGGCDYILDIHRDIAERYDNPPAWSRESG